MSDEVGKILNRLEYDQEWESYWKAMESGFMPPSRYDFTAGWNSANRRNPELEKLKAENEKLRVNLNTCKKDYWFMTNLLERYSTNKDEAIKDCIERMKFRKGLFNILNKDELNKQESSSE